MVDKTNMEKEFVPYDMALALKELGFNENCFGCYTKDKEISLDYSDNRGEGHYFQVCAAPLYQQAFRWLQDNSYDENGESLIQDYLDTRWFRTLYSPVHQDVTLRECIKIFKQENKDE